MKLMSLSNLEAIKYTYIPFTERFSEAFGNREKGGIWMVYGKAGQGKSRFVMDLAKEFAEIGMKVLFATLEMGYCKDFREELAAHLGTTYTDMTTRQKGNTYYRDYSLTPETKEQYPREYGYDGTEFLYAG